MDDRGKAGRRWPKPRKSARRDQEPIVAYDSKLKLGILSLPCFVVVAIGLQGIVTGVSMLGGGMMTHLAAAGIGALTALTLLQMAFDNKPVLVIDENGITCRRPDIGTIPWRAVVGLGTSRAAVLRRVLMVAVDESKLDEKARQHLKD